MSDTHPTAVPAPSDLDRQRFRKLMLFVVLGMIASFVVGGIGGFMVWEANSGKSIPYALVLAPTMVACVVFMGPLYFVRKKWFPTKEALQAAAGLPKK